MGRHLTTQVIKINWHKTFNFEIKRKLLTNLNLMSFETLILWL
jgi:hypothetical protein